VLTSIALIIVMYTKDIVKHFVRRFLFDDFEESFDIVRFCSETNNAQICCDESNDKYQKDEEGCFEELLDSLSDLGIYHLYIWISLFSAIFFTAFSCCCL